MKEAVPQQELLMQHWLGPPRGGAGGAAPAGESDGVVGGLLFATAGGGDPGELVLAFDRLAAWVDRSLDLYRPELSRVLFPAFAHTYLNLLRLEATAEAQQLMAAHRQRFLDAAVGGSSLRMQVGWGGRAGRPRCQALPLPGYLLAAARVCPARDPHTHSRCAAAAVCRSCKTSQASPLQSPWPPAAQPPRCASAALPSASARRPTTSSRRPCRWVGG